MKKVDEEANFHGVEEITGKVLLLTGNIVDMLIWRWLAHDSGALGSGG